MHEQEINHEQEVNELEAKRMVATETCVSFWNLLIHPAC
jgi:hypothetical protein